MTQTWKDDLFTLLEQYETSGCSEDALIAEHIQNVVDSNEENDPELKDYILASLEEVIQAAQHAMSALCRRPPTKKEHESC
jgi:hypothetical protein